MIVNLGPPLANYSVGDQDGHSLKVLGPCKVPQQSFTTEQKERDRQTNPQTGTDKLHKWHQMIAPNPEIQ